MNKKAISDQFSRELSNSSEPVKKGRLHDCLKFLDFAPEDFSQWNKELVYNFLNQLKKEEYADGTIRKVYGIVKRVFDAAKTVHEMERVKLISSVDANKPAAIAEVLKAMALPGPSWDVGKRASPPIRTEEVVAPALTLDEITQMIGAARAGQLEVDEVIYLALGSVYGLRREELCQVRREDIDFEGGTIFMRTVKGGERRRQLLAQALISYLERYDFGIQVSPYRMSSMFKRIQHKSGVKSVDSGGWHSIRRYLNTALRDTLAGVPNFRRDAQLITKIFLRWRLSSSSEMTDHYYTISPIEADRLALEYHPVLSLWED